MTPWIAPLLLAFPLLAAAAAAAPDAPATPPADAAAQARGYLAEGLKASAQGGFCLDGVAQISKALELDPTLGDGYKAMGACYEELHDQHAASAHYRKLLIVAPDHPHAPAARKFLEAHGKKGPTPPEMLFEGRLLLLKGRCKEAVGPLERALAADAKLADAHKYLGSCFAQLQQPEKGAEHYRKFVQARPADPSADKIRAFLAQWEASRKK